MKQNLDRNTILLIAAAIIWIATPVYSSLNRVPEITASAACPSGRSEARLTGWMFNNKMPIGSAVYDEKTRQLEVKIKNVALPDGEQLNILIGDDRIGETAALAGGAATTVLTQNLKEGDRVSIFNGERALVSANLVCAEPSLTQTPTPTVTPSPTPSPTMTPSPTPTGTPAPMPPATPTATPMPSPTLR